MTDLHRYLSGLTVTQGRRAGDPLKVLPWQRDFIAGAFAEGVQSAALSVARGNGKTALLSGIAAATLDGPLAVPRGETVIVASSFSQARIAFDHVRAFMADQLKDRHRWRIQDTAQQASIEDRETGARVKVIGSDPKRAHGLAPVLVLADEPAQWPTSTGERMVAALRTSAGKQPHFRFVALGTRRRPAITGSRRCWRAAATTLNRTRPNPTIRNSESRRGARQTPRWSTCRTFARRSRPRRSTPDPTRRWSPNSTRSG